jgi:hypothetical protein
MYVLSRVIFYHTIKEFCHNAMMQQSVKVFIGKFSNEHPGAIHIV